MSGLVLMIIALCVLIGAYLVYGRWLAKTWGIDPNAKTPAYELNDGLDYVPADTNVVFGHQFASIAGAGPINGPIQAALFGWLPVLLWVLLGGVFFGAVQDFAAMYVSVKNKGKTIGHIIEKYVGKLGKRLFLAFTWLFSILVVAAFADVVATTFNGFTADGSLNKMGGAVSMTSILFVAAAVLLGFLIKNFQLNKWVNTFTAIVLLIACIYLGLQFPVFLNASTWRILVFAYIAIASIVPVWALLQPRDYLNSYLLIAMILAAVAGILIFNPAMNLNAFNGFIVGKQTLFPYLFVTIACGAVSGFHALVSSGTSSKQIKNERDMLPVSFGAMLLESMLAIIALIAVGYVSSSGQIPAGSPPVIFANGVAAFLTKLHIPESISKNLITLSVSAFALTSLDSVARIGRLAFQEFFEDSDNVSQAKSALNKIQTNKYFSTFVTLIVAYALAKMGYKNIWPLFGSANQLLSALALIACAVYLKKTKRQGWMLWAPMLIMLAVTLSMLVIQTFNLLYAISEKINIAGNILQLAFAIALFILGVVLSLQGLQKLMEKTSTASSN